MSDEAPFHSDWAGLPYQVQYQLNNDRLMNEAAMNGNWDRAEELANTILLDVQVPLLLRARAHSAMAAMGGYSGLNHAEDALDIMTQMWREGKPVHAEDVAHAKNLRRLAQEDVNHGRRSADGEDGEMKIRVEANDPIVEHINQYAVPDRTKTLSVPSHGVSQASIASSSSVDEHSRASAVTQVEDQTWAAQPEILAILTDRKSPLRSKSLPRKNTPNGHAICKTRSATPNKRLPKF